MSRIYSDDEEAEILGGHRANELYVTPARSGDGAYVKLLSEGEELVGEVEFTGRTRIAVTLFHRNSSREYSTIKLNNIKFSRGQWEKDGEIIIHQTGRAAIQEFLQLLLSLELDGSTKARISLGALNLDALAPILNTEHGEKLIKQLSESPNLSEDIFALAHKKEALGEFERLLTNFDGFRSEYVETYGVRKRGEEAIWQDFFERNTWIFGHGLNYVFLDKVEDKLETYTTGASHTTFGNRVDALMKTKAAISQYVLIEIKTASLNILRSEEYRSGCWSVSPDITDAVSQVQKTVYDFSAEQIRKVQQTDDKGNRTGEEIFRIQPKCYLVVGNLSQMKGNDDKFTCFQIFRNALSSPEIITFDELYERAKCIVQTISAPISPDLSEPAKPRRSYDLDDDIPDDITVKTPTRTAQPSYDLDDDIPF